MHEDQSLPSYVNQRVLALHRYAIALKQGDLDGVAAVLHAAEQDHALGKMIQEFNAIAQEENHLMIAPQSISHVQELLRTYRSAHSPNEQTPAGVILPTDPATDLSGREKQTTHSIGERLVGATTHRHRLTSLAQAVAAVLIVGSLLGCQLSGPLRISSRAGERYYTGARSPGGNTCAGNHRRARIRLAGERPYSPLAAEHWKRDYESDHTAADRVCCYSHQGFLGYLCLKCQGRGGELASLPRRTVECHTRWAGR